MLAALLVLLPAVLALPQDFDLAPGQQSGAFPVISCDSNNAPVYDDCWSLLESMDTWDVTEANAICIEVNGRRDACCVSWSRECRIPQKEIKSRAVVVLNRCGSGSSGTVMNAGSCLGTVCVSNRSGGCGDGPHVNDPSPWNWHSG
jgi:hypothetical protein